GWDSDEHRDRGSRRSGSDGRGHEARRRGGASRASRGPDAAPRGRRSVVAAQRDARMTEDAGHQSGPVTAARGGVTDARVAAADICADLRGGELLDTSFERRVASLDARDTRWTQELLYGMLRRRAWLDAALSERVRGGLARLDPDPDHILRPGIYQLAFLRAGH